MGTTLDKDLQSMVNLGMKLLVNFNAFKTNRLSFNHHRRNVSAYISTKLRLNSMRATQKLGLTFSK